MSIKLMYITNRPEVALIAEKAGVDRIFVDLEYIGKEFRQGGMDTVKSKHTLDDVKTIRDVLTKAELLVRVNPIHSETKDYCSSEDEIDIAIKNGADILMLPYFKTINEVKRFIQYVAGRCKAMLLVETPEAVDQIDDILNIDGIDEVFIGLNDLGIGYHKKFMFEVLADGTVDMLVEKFVEKGLPYGFGGLASLEKGLLPGKYVLQEHYRLKSSCVILSRSFCNVNVLDDIDEISEIFINGIAEIRSAEILCSKITDFSINKNTVHDIVNKIVKDIE